MRVLLLPLVIAACSAPPPPVPLDESERGVDVGADLHVAVHKGVTVRSVAGDAPGESALVIDGRVIAAAPGPDDLPLLLDDGHTVVFVSGRSGVASLWRVDVDDTHLQQLTNIGVKPGHLGSSFVPVPARSMEQDGDAVRYDDGSGRLWRVSVTSGTVLR